MEPEDTYSGPERRESPRYQVSLRARWGGEWAERRGTVTNLSTDGCFVLADDPVAEGELVQVQVELSGGETLSLWGSVVHTGEGLGFAIQFSTFSLGGARERLRQLLRDAGATGP